MAFDSYAAYYDLLYREKDYKEEARFVHDQIQTSCPGAKTILDLGCGTGKHAFELAKLGYEICGVDLARQMIDIAIENAPSDARLEFQQGDLRTIRLPRKFDVVISLFHVISYQATNGDLLAAFNTVKSHINKNGIFLFDVWYGPGVLVDPPSVRIKRMEDDRIQVLRIAEPTMYREKNLVDVDYEVHIKGKEDGRETVIREKHTMRYIFDTELDFIGEKIGFKSVEITKLNETLTPSGWFKAFVFKEV